MENEEKAEVIAVQDPWIGKADGGTKKQRRANEETQLGSSEITVASSNYDIIFKQNCKARVMWMIRKNAGIKYDTRDDLWDNPDTGIIDIKTRGGRLRIINIYNQAGTDREGWCMKRVPHGITRGQTTIMLGDFNAKGAEWDEGAEPIREEMIRDTVQRETLTCLNENGRHTCQRGEKSATLDLT